MQQRTRVHLREKPKMPAPPPPARPQHTSLASTRASETTGQPGTQEGMEDQVTQKNADQIKCKIYAEGANAPTSLDADLVLEDNGVFIIPDILCNSGGVVVSYFEWVQGLQSYFWGVNEVYVRMDKIITRAFDETYALKQSKNVGMRLAATMLGIRQVAEAAKIRGLYP